MRKLTTITIGIPAFNEEANICFLIQDILAQKQEGFVIKKILVSSDGCTDNTVSEVKKITSKLISVLENKKRSGLAVRQNQIIDHCDSDILIIMNADTRIADISCIKNLVAPICSGSADLTSPYVEEMNPRTHFENILWVSTQMKKYLFTKYKRGKNVYTCHGQTRAFSKNLYTKLKFPSSIGEDAYSYFYAITNGMKYQYVDNAVVLYRLPSNYRDHKKQSIRFFQSQKLLGTQFNLAKIKKEYAFPKLTLMTGIVHSFLKYPLQTIEYIFMEIYLKNISLRSKKIKETWDISKSSKVNTRTN